MNALYKADTWEGPKGVRLIEKSWIVRILWDVRKNFQGSDCVLRLQDELALVYKVIIYI